VTICRFVSIVELATASKVLVDLMKENRRCHIHTSVSFSVLQDLRRNRMSCTAGVQTDSTPWNTHVPADSVHDMTGQSPSDARDKQTSLANCPRFDLIKNRPRTKNDRTSYRATSATFCERLVKQVMTFKPHSSGFKNVQPRHDRDKIIHQRYNSTVTTLPHHRLLPAVVHISSSVKQH
jgi:hypothetical protein